MRFMMIVKADQNSEAGCLPNPKLMAAIEKHAAELTRDGVLLLSEGLHASSKGAVVQASGGKLKVTDGPFAEAKELIGGFAILRADSKAEAIELGKQFMKLHQDVLGPEYEGTLEIRQVFDPSDFGPAGADAASASVAAAR
jgi:hypothetical protein